MFETCKTSETGDQCEFEPYMIKTFKRFCIHKIQDSAAFTSTIKLCN